MPLIQTVTAVRSSLEKMISAGCAAGKNDKDAARKEGQES